MKTIKAALVALTLVTSLGAHAGVYGDDMARCLVDKSTQEDKLAFVQWMFTAMALHPAVSEIAPVPDSARTQANKKVGKLMVELMSERCLNATKKAIKYEGQVAIQSSFQVFGQIAAQELFAHPNVAAGLSQLENFVDGDALNEKLGIAGE